MSELFHPQPRDRSLTALVALTGHARAAGDLPTLFGRLTDTVAELMEAEGALFGRLDGTGLLRGQPRAHGLEDALVAGLEAPCTPEGTGFAERIVFGGEVFRAAIGSDPGFAPYRPVLEALGLREGLAVPWRAGDSPLGLLVVYNPREGSFSEEDVPVLLAAAQVAALVVEHQRAAARSDLQSAIVDSLGEGVVVSRFPDGPILWANPALHRMFGYAEGELAGRPSWQLLASSGGAPAAELLEQVAAHVRERGQWTGEILSERRDGSRFWRRLSVTTIDHPEHGELWIGVSSDVTQMKRAAEVLAAARDAAEAASRAKSEYLSRMSHELRTPLTAIIGFADLLLMDERRTRSRDGLQSILRAGEHLLAIVNDILDIAQVESRQLRLELAPVEVGGLVDQCCRLMAVAAENRRITLRSEIAEPLWVRADAQRLNQVVLNLLSNAIKYNRDGGAVTVAASAASPERVRLTVLDTGVGISPDRANLLFQPFQRLDAQRSGVRGSGLGLALSRQLVEAMGGRIGFESAARRGSTFWVDLAAAEEPASDGEAGSAPETPPGAAEAGAATVRTVLHIEDDAATARVVEQAFEHRPSIRLISAMRGRLGMRLANEEHPDLILLDLHLPDVDGVDLLRRLRTRPRTREIPVAVISADATARDRPRVLQAGALAYLVKPLRIQALLQFVDSALGLSGARPGGEEAGAGGEPPTAAAASGGG